MTHEVETVWMGKMQFNALVNGHTVVMDAPERVGGEDQGPIPKPFMLVALTGCTGMDVVALMRKAGKPLDRCDVRAIAELTKTHPIAYTSIHVVYDIQGKEEYRDETLATVQRSQNELCGVSFMLKKAMPVTWEVYFNGAMIFTNSASAVGSTTPG
ncbi:MAG: OsmC family protein [Flavobacteriales bacterium]|nr:OsmC family protein [Flavobacteriales bacterium]